MFHGVFVYKSGHRRVQGTPKEAFTVLKGDDRHFDDETFRNISLLLIQAQGIQNERLNFAVCFTVCFFISPDIDGYRAPQKRHSPF